MIPQWLTKENPPLAQPVAAGCGSHVSRGRGGFLGRTIEQTAGFFRDALLTDSVAKRNGFLQSLDPRVKLCTMLGLVFSVSDMRTPVPIWGVYLFALLVAVVSSVPVGLFLKRVWLFVPIFSAVIVIPALFNVVTPGEPLWTLAQFSRSHDFGPYHLPATLAVTRQGVLTAATFIGRVAASVSLVVLLTLTTVWSDLLRALRVFRVPQIFVLILTMAFRYLLLLVETIQNIHIARRSRTLRYGPTAVEQRWVASRMGYLFKRTYQMSQDVHQAMLSRGFSGEILALSTFKTAPRDHFWCLITAVFAITMLLFDRGMLHW